MRYDTMQQNRQFCCMENSMWNTQTLHDRNGQRKYLTIVERNRFLEATKSMPIDRRLYCYVLACTGCRVSEALNLTRRNLDPAMNLIIFETLKQRKRGVYRAVPVPAELIELLLRLPVEEKFFRFSRWTCWRFIKQAMQDADITGSGNMMPKAVRHSYGIGHAQSKTPPNMTQKWFGHAKIETTHIYMNASGEEERAFASSIWPSFDSFFEKKL